MVSYPGNDLKEVIEKTMTEMKEDLGKRLSMIMEEVAEVRLEILKGIVGDLVEAFDRDDIPKSRRLAKRVKKALDRLGEQTSKGSAFGGIRKSGAKYPSAIAAFNCLS